MLLEDILLAAAVGVALVIGGVPIFRLVKLAPWRRKDPLAEAQERLRIAKLEVEIAKVHRETEKIYEGLYGETLGDERAAKGAPGVSEGEPAEAPKEATPDGKAK
ncbi:MAG TPA: hypothetical protein VGM06_05600 [Polyangiaceae bacterium]|jgi:hypothetical protein